MIQRETIEGRTAIVAYLTDEMVPTEAENATLVKIIFEDGEIRFGTRASAEQRQRQDKMALARAAAQALLAKRFDPSQPRDEDGKWTEGGGSGGAASSEAKPSAAKKKVTVKKEDFDKAGVTIPSSPERQKVTIEKWNKFVGIDPEEFKKEFLGGLEGTMTVHAYEGRDNDIAVIGDISGKGRRGKSGQTGEGLMVGHYERKFNVENKHAYSSLFRVEKDFRGSGIGKHMLAGNVAMYQKLGIDHVDVNAALDVGGHAWAKYGYVPEQGSWDALRARLEREVTGTGGPLVRSGPQAESWDQLPEARQQEVHEVWVRDSHNEFLANEAQNWRDSGQAKNDAKILLADEFTNNRVTTGDIPEWINESLDGARKIREERGEPPIPYTNRQIYDAMNLEYQGGDGEDDPEISWDEDMLKQPEGYDPAQGTLPGIEPEDPTQRLTEDMRKRLERRMIAAFDEKAEANAQEMEPPAYLNDGVEEYQNDFWSDLDDDERLRIAERLDLATLPLEEKEEDEQGQMALEEQVDPLLEALRDPNPKALWRVADHPRGKELLPGKNWSGRLDFNDKESMDRFHEYVGRVKYA